MSDGTVGHLRVGQASNASDFRPLVAPAAALPQVQCQTFSMSDIERSWRGKMASQGHFAPSQGRDSGFAAASVIVITRRASVLPPGPRAEPWQAPNRPGRRQICTHIYDGGTSMRLLRDFSSHSTFHGKPSPRLDRLGVRWLSGSEPFTETHRRHCVTVSCRNNVKV